MQDSVCADYICVNPHLKHLNLAPAFKPFRENRHLLCVYATWRVKDNIIVLYFTPKCGHTALSSDTLQIKILK